MEKFFQTLEMIGKSEIKNPRHENLFDGKRLNQKYPDANRLEIYVRDFPNFVGPGPVRSEIFQILLVLVRFGPRFSKFCWSWSGSVPDFPNFVGPGPVRS